MGGCVGGSVWVDVCEWVGMCMGGWGDTIHVLPMYPFRIDHNDLLVIYHYIGIISVLPDADSLATAVYSSCMKLIEHIGTQAQACVSVHSDQGNSREVC